MKQDRPIILVADDEAVNQKVLSLTLEKLGYNFVLADNGEDALEKAKTAEPDLVFFDIFMPKMNGFEAARNLRSCGYKKPIIAFTATLLPEDEENCKKSGINDVLIKPIKFSVIQKTLEKWLPSEEELSLLGAFDAKEMLDAFMNETEIVLPLLSRFIERTRSQLENFPALKAAGDWANARRDAHTIKGAAATMGGAELSKAADALEKACLKASAEEAEAAHSRLLEIFAKYKKGAEEFIHDKQSR